MQPVKLRPQAKLKPQAKGAPTPPPLTPVPRRAPPPRPLPQADSDEDGPAPPRRPPPLRQTLEAYFSDTNLKTDRHLREAILGSPGGWVDVDVVLELKRVRVLKARREDALQALREAPGLEFWHDPADGAAAVRRAKGRTLPKFEGAPPAPPPRRVAPAPAPEPEELEEEEAAPPDEEAAPPPSPSAVELDEPEEDDEGAPVKRRRCINAEVRAGARFVGRIASFHKGLGMGFVSCRPTFEVFGRDLAVDKATVKSFLVGECVAFSLAVDPAFGTPKAIDMEAANEADIDFCIQEAPEPAAVKKVAKPGAAKLAAARAARTRAAARPPPAATAAAPRAAAPAGGLAGMRFVGTILSVDEAGDGKITCEETFAALGRHVTVLAEELTGFEAGDTVSFGLRAAKAVELEAE